MTRREFIRNAAIVGAGALWMPEQLFGADESRSLILHNIHTDDYLDITYFKNGSYLRDALTHIDNIMVDRRSGDITSMNPGLLDTLYRIQSLSGVQEPIEIICGYRSPQTNSKMARPGSGVAKHSYHTRGMAADINIKSLPLEQIRRIARGLNAGGVGYYPGSGFIHVDVGPVRQWMG